MKNRVARVFGVGAEPERGIRCERLCAITSTPAQCWGRATKPKTRATRSVILKITNSVYIPFIFFHPANQLQLVHKIRIALLQ